MVNWGTAESLAIKLLGAAVVRLGGPVGRWWLQRQIKPASGDKLAVLVSKISGDGSANSTQLSIREAIARALPEIDVYSWPAEWQLPDGEERKAQADAHRLARRWLKSKNCNLLITGRMKSNSIVSLKFIPAGYAQSTEEVQTGSQTYSLLLDTLDLPIEFIDDLASALATCVVSNLNQLNTAGVAPSALRRIATNLENIVDTSNERIDARIRARLTNCSAAGRALLFEFGGKEEDLKLAIGGFADAYRALDQSYDRSERFKYKRNYGSALARLASITGNEDQLRQALEAMLEGLPSSPVDLTQWSAAQLNIASLYYALFQISSQIRYLHSALEVCDQTISEELLAEQPTLWAAVQDQYGISLTALAEVQPGDDAINRALEALTHALEIWTAEFPVRRATALINLSNALIALGSRQSNPVGYTEAIIRLREAERLISHAEHLRLWLALQNNLGLCLTILADTDEEKYREPIAILRAARGMVSRIDVAQFSRLSLSLAKALMFYGKYAEAEHAINESISIFDSLRNAKEPSVRNEAANNIGIAYQLLGIATNSVEALDQSRNDAVCFFPHTAGVGRHLERDWRPDEICSHIVSIRRRDLGWSELRLTRGCSNCLGNHSIPRSGNVSRVGSAR